MTQLLSSHLVEGQGGLPFVRSKVLACRPQFSWWKSPLVTVYYLDASAWVKRYYEESGTLWVQNLFVGDVSIASASLGLVEVMATLSRKRKACEIDASDFEEKAGELARDWHDFIHVHMTEEAIEIATGLAREKALRGADAVHLAAALMLRRRLNPESDEVVLVASDRELKSAAASVSLLVVDPEERAGNGGARTPDL